VKKSYAHKTKRPPLGGRSARRCYLRGGLIFTVCTIATIGRFVKAHGNFTVKAPVVEQSVFPAEVPKPDGFVLRRPTQWR